VSDCLLLLLVPLSLLVVTAVPSGEAGLQPERRRIPLWLKLAHTAFLAVLVPVYWTAPKYGPANFLWFSDIALFVLLFALWLESPFLASTQAVSVGLLETAWVLDFLLALILGKSPFGMTAYMLDPKRDLFIRGLSLFHVWMPPLLVWLVWRLGYDRRALLAQTALCWVVLPVSYFVSSKEANINWVFGPGGEPPEWLAAPRFLFGLMLFLPICVYLPTHFLLRRFFPQRPDGSPRPGVLS
jgi:hypothetical protein